MLIDRGKPDDDESKADEHRMMSDGQSEGKIPIMGYLWLLDLIYCMKTNRYRNTG